jgi:hypothetical protein
MMRTLLFSLLLAQPDLPATPGFSAGLPAQPLNLAGPVPVRNVLFGRHDGWTRGFFGNPDQPEPSEAGAPGSLMYGVGVNSNAGLVGSVTAVPPCPICFNWLNRMPAPQAPIPSCHGLVPENQTVQRRQLLDALRSQR